MQKAEKKHFKEKIKYMDVQIWNLEFTRFQISQIRESIRQEYDQLRSRKEAINSTLKTEKDEVKITEMKDQLEKVENGEKVMLQQMQDKDIQVNGCKECEQFPDGVQGLNEQIEVARMTQQLYKDYLKRK